MVKQYEYLSQEDIDHFLTHGYIVVKNAFSAAQAAEFAKDVWVRLGVDPHDRATWDRERVHMPAHRYEPVATFAPRAWGAITELLGGEDRVDPAASAWGDSFIVNLGPPALDPSSPSPSPSPSPITSTFYSTPLPTPAVPGALDPRALSNWHVDGDFFLHFLDSPEQALLVIPLFTDIVPGGGATYIAPDGLAPVARYLAAHPEGVYPRTLSFVPSGVPGAGDMSVPVDELRRRAADSDSADADGQGTGAGAGTGTGKGGFWAHLDAARACSNFVELTGSAGDVVLLHPLMLHSASPNVLRAQRVITNPRVELRAPFQFARTGAPGDEYSVVERATLRALGVDRLEFAPGREREGVVPARIALQAKLAEEERRRLEEARAKRADAPAGMEVGAGAIAVA